MVILEKGTKEFTIQGPDVKLVHQLSCTHDPIFNLRPASQIIGGYTIKDGVIVPNYTHNEVIEAVFRRTRDGGDDDERETSFAIEPVIRYQRTRYRGGDAASRHSALRSRHSAERTPSIG